MGKSLIETLDPSAVEPFKNYIKELILGARFTYEWHENIDEDDDGNVIEVGPKLLYILSFEFPQPILRKIETMLGKADYLDRKNMNSIFHEPLENFIKGNDVLRDRLLKRESSTSIIRTCEMKTIITRDITPNAVEDILLYLYLFPFEYEVLIPLPHVVLSTNRPFVISDDIKLIRLTRDLGINKYFGSDMYGNWTDEGDRVFIMGDPQDRYNKVPLTDVTYVVIKSYGHHVDSHYKSILRYAFKPLGIFIAALIVSGILEQRNLEASQTPSPYDVLSYVAQEEVGLCYIFRPEMLQNSSDFAQGLFQRIRRNFRIPFNDWDLINSLNLNHEVLEPSQLEKAAIERGKRGDSPDESSKRLEIRLRPIQNLFRLDHPKEKLDAIERIKNALKWFYDALSNDNESFSFIQLTIALETLLSDPDDKSNVTKHLSNACAYLLAKDAVERKRIAKDFMAGYNVRSTIVHEGKNQLSQDDAVHYLNLKDFLMRALVREMGGLLDAY